jgi:hypothetical protein
MTILSSVASLSWYCGLNSKPWVYYVCYPLRCAPALFILVIFQIESHIFALGCPLTMIHLPSPPKKQRLQMWPTTPSLLLRQGLIEVFAQAGLKLYYSRFCLFSSWDYRLVSSYLEPLFFFLFYFGSTGVWSQWFTLARHALYHLNYSASPLLC